MRSTRKALGDRVFAHSIRRLRADELGKVVGGEEMANQLDGEFGMKGALSQDNQGKCMA